MSSNQDKPIKELLPDTKDELNRQLLTEKNYNELYRTNERFIHYYIKRYRNITQDYDELVSCANLGFTKAMQAFDLSSGVKFIVYASYLINNEILMLNRKNNTQMSKGTTSYDAALFCDEHGNELTLLDTLVSDTNIEADYLKQEEKEQFYAAVHLLKPKYKQVILLTLDGCTERQIAKDLGLSQSYVSRIKKKAILSLQEIIKKLEKQSKEEKCKMHLKNAIVPKPERKSITSQSTTPIASTPSLPTQSHLLLRNLTFESMGMLYTINNEASKNLQIMPVSSNIEETLLLDKVQAQTLIADLEELVAYL